jgi:hypothetical protein
MTTKVRIWVASAMLAAMLGLAFVSSPSAAQGKKKEVDVAVKEIADELKKGNKAAAKKMADDAAKNLDEISDMMHLFRPRNKGGLGVGSTPLTNPAKDGIEVMIRDLSRDVPGGIAKQAASLQEMGYHIAAMGELANAAVAKAPVGGGKKTKKAWTEMSEDMRSLGLAFAKASAGKGGQEIKTAANKVNANCNKCHSIFKE